MKNFIYAQIDQQFQKNAHINMFYRTKTNGKTMPMIKPSEESYQMVNYQDRIFKFLDKEMKRDQGLALIEYMTENAIQLFTVNQEIEQLPYPSILRLEVAYTDLVNSFYQLLQRQGIKKENIDRLLYLHGLRLQEVLLCCETHPDFRGYLEAYLQRARYVEYDPGLILNVLDLDPRDMKEPVLDVGSGEHGYLVAHLHALGKDAYGIDPFGKKTDRLHTDVLESFGFQGRQWGSMVVHMSIEDGIPLSPKDLNLRLETMTHLFNQLESGGTLYVAPMTPDHIGAYQDHFKGQHIHVSLIEEVDLQAPYFRMHITKR